MFFYFTPFIRFSLDERLLWIMDYLKFKAPLFVSYKHVN